MIDPFGAKLMLDWCLGGAAASQPSGRWISFATATPTSQSAFDGGFNGRCTVTFAAANSPQGSATNLNAISATATVAATVVGFNLWNSTAGGTRLGYGTLSAAIGCKSGDTMAFAVGALTITLG